MVITEFTTLFGQIKVEKVDHPTHPECEYVAFFEDANIGECSLFGWVRFGQSMGEALSGLLTDHAELIKEMLENMDKPRH